MSADIALQEKSKALLRSLKDKQQQLHAIVQPGERRNRHGVLVHKPTLQDQNHELVVEARRKLFSRNLESILCPSQSDEAGLISPHSPSNIFINNAKDTGKNVEKVRMLNDSRIRARTESPVQSLGETHPKYHINQYTEKVQTVDKLAPKSFTVSSKRLEKKPLERSSKTATDHTNREGSHHMVESPNTIRRKVIDKNIHIGNNLVNECETPEKLNSKQLNFSYSRYNEADYDFVQERLENSPKIGDVQNGFGSSISIAEEEIRGHSGSISKDISEEYEEHLQDPGNSRKIAGFIKDTTTKPKSVVFSRATGNQVRN